MKLSNQFCPNLGIPVIEKKCGLAMLEVSLSLSYLSKPDGADGCYMGNLVDGFC
jgi:hypothetical protein